MTDFSLRDNLDLPSARLQDPERNRDRVPHSIETVLAGNGALWPGDTGMSVQTVQAQLQALGYQTPVDGVYGAPTKQAVREFQERHGLEAYGVVNQSTMRKLNEESPPDKLGDRRTDNASPDTSERAKASTVPRKVLDSMVNPDPSPLRERLRVSDFLNTLPPHSPWAQHLMK